jgi:hypothetical protein
MTKYQVQVCGALHTVEADTVDFLHGCLWFGSDKSTVAMFTSFDWLKVVPEEEKPTEEDASSTETPELSGE